MTEITTHEINNPVINVKEIRESTKICLIAFDRQLWRVPQNVGQHVLKLDPIGHRTNTQNHLLGSNERHVPSIKKITIRSIASDLAEIDVRWSLFDVDDKSSNFLLSGYLESPFDPFWAVVSASDRPAADRASKEPILEEVLSDDERTGSVNRSAARSTCSKDGKDISKLPAEVAESVLEIGKSGD